jgi:general secretion pathway protein E
MKKDSQTKEKAESLAKAFDIPSLSDLTQFPFIKERIAKLPYPFAKTNKILALEENEKRVSIASSEPWNLSLLQEARLFLGKELQIFFCSQKILEEALERCYHQGQKEVPNSALEGSSNEMPKEEAEGYDLLDPSSQNSVVRFLNTVIIEAIEQGASDIHLDPQEEGLHIRFRIDGVLQKRFDANVDVKAQLITRLKVMAKLDIAQQRLPQDGRIKLKIGGRQIDFRLSTVPVVFGERIVLRLLDPENVVLGMAKIGMPTAVVSLFRKLMEMPEGILLVTGPTGSGKTTTLYSAIMEMNADEMNIMTVEDPVEYKLAKIAQIGVNPKIHLNFSSGLRHILRQDPDVIMIGEIRDRETAEIAIQAALTGHLVLSTLHTNDAPSALTRLSDMGIEPYLLSSSVVGVLAQRLVRKICSKCKQSYTPSAEELKEIGLPKCPSLYRGKGCDACFGSGYKGRQGIFELLQVNSEVRKQMVKSMDANELRSVSLGSMHTLYQSAAELVKNGITTSAEAIRLLRNFD